MTKRLLIDATHSEELRVALAEDDRIQDFETETAGKAQLKGNIFIAEVSRVEPSLQAAFITYGSARNGFLAFNELHPAFFDVPATEKQSLLEEMVALAERKKQRHQQDGTDDGADEDTLGGPRHLEEDAIAADAQAHTQVHTQVDIQADAQAVALDDEDARALALVNQMENPDAASAAAISGTHTGGGQKSKFRRNSRTASNADEPSPNTTNTADGMAGNHGHPATFAERKPPIHRRYRIDQVLKPGQKILVQVVKEERGSKGAALTTYFTLPGRYTVLMPNTPYAGGISRKISDPNDRKSIKATYDTLQIPDDMGLIVRTAGVGQPAEAIQHDLKNLRNLWEHMQQEFQSTSESIRCVHEDGSVVIRAIRDMIKDDVDEIHIAGNRVYKQAKEFAKALVPEYANRIKEYKNDTPIFVEYDIEEQLAQLHHTRVTLPSGGYLVINPTEALVSIDINSGRSTQERNIEETALKTNLEAADEIARQIRLRDLSGLIVIDFIDMEEFRHTRAVERAMRKALRRDRARVQCASISQFGLMEISRQRLRPSFVESHFVTCEHCRGSGVVFSNASGALLLLRRLEQADVQEADRVVVHTATPLVLYILNHKRDLIRDLEAKYKFQIQFQTSAKHIAPDFAMDLVRVKSDGSETTQTLEVSLREEPELPPEERYRNNRRRDRNTNRKKDRPHRRPDIADTSDAPVHEPIHEPVPEIEQPAAADSAHTRKSGGKQRPTRRGRPGKRPTNDAQPERVETLDTPAPTADAEAAAPQPKRRGRPRKADANAQPEQAPAAPAATPQPQPKPQPVDAPVAVQTIGDAPATTSNTTSESSGKSTFQRWWNRN